MTTEAKPDCPVCGAGYLTEHRGECEIEHRGTRETRPSWYSVCSGCGSEIATAEQTRRNKRDTLAFRKRVDGLLSGSEIARVREQLGLTQKEAAQVFGGGPTAFSKYEHDDVVQSEAMDRLLRVAANVPAAYRWLAAHAGLATKRETYHVVMHSLGRSTRKRVISSPEGTSRITNKAIGPCTIRTGGRGSVGSPACGIKPTRSTDPLTGGEVA